MSFPIKIPASITTHVRRLSSNPASTFRNKSKAGGIWQTTAGILKWDEAGTVRTAAYDGQSGLALTSPALTSPSGVVTALEAAFTQVAGNKVHTATFTIPAGATILDIFVTNVTVWDSDTSATLKVGLVDDDCFFVGARLDSAGTLAAGTTANFIWTGGYQGASVPAIDGGGANDVLGAANGFLYKATAQSLTAIVTDVNVSGVAGRTRVTVLYSLPSAVIAPVVV